jgi:hypothetical protein
MPPSCRRSALDLSPPGKTFVKELSDGNATSKKRIILPNRKTRNQGDQRISRMDTNFSTTEEQSQIIVN